MTGTWTGPGADTAAARRSESRRLGEEVKARLLAYLDRIGVQNAAIKENLAEESLHRAHRKVAEGSDDELLLRALEELQRRIDGAVARALGLSGVRDAHAVAAARAALLLDDNLRPKLETLLSGSEELLSINELVRPAIPCSTPPESPLSMPDQNISFFFSRPSK